MNKIKAYLFKLTFINTILILVQGSSNCGIGCYLCATDSNSNAQKCTACLEGYQFDSSNNLCVYSQCLDNFYFQIDENSNSDSTGSCVSICNPLFIGDPIQKICKKLIECSSSFATQQNFVGLDIAQDFFAYQNQYYVAIQQGYLSIYENQNLQLIAHVNSTQNDLKIQNVNGVIVVLTNNNQVILWDIINNQRTFIINKTNFDITIQTQLSNFMSQFFLIQQINSVTLTLQIIYDQVNQKSSYSNQLQINIDQQQFQIENDLLIIKNEQNISVSQIILNSQSNNLMIQLGNTTKCDTTKVGSFISIQKTSSLFSYLTIHSDGVLILNLNTQQCSLKYAQQGIQKGKLIEISDNLGQIYSYLIYMNQQNLYNFNMNTQSLQKVTDQSILDFEIGHFLKNDNQIFVLQDQLVIIFDIDQLINQFTIYQSLILMSSPSNQIKKIQQSYQQNNTLEQNTKYQIVMLGQSIQIVRGNTQNSQLEIEIVDNYQLSYPTPNSQVNSLTLIYNPLLLVTCHQNGDIIFYDVSSGIEMQFIIRLQFQSQSCLQIERFSSNDIVVQMNQQILLIDPYLQLQKKLINLNNTNSFSINNDKMVISFGNCIALFSLDFQNLFQQCDDQYIQVKNIFLDADLKIIIQTNQAIQIYQIQISPQQQISLLHQIQSSNNITYFNCITIFDSDQDLIKNSYSIDEIVYFDSQQNFFIFDNQLQLVHQVSKIALISINQAKRVINDTSVYFLIGLSDSDNPVVKIHAVSKNSMVSYKIDSFQYSPFIDDPVKIINSAGSVFYHVKHIMQLNFYTVHEEYQIDIARNITYTYGHDYIVGATQTVQAKMKLGSQNNFIDYAGTQQGLSGSLNYQFLRYTTLDTSNIFSSQQPSDEIQEIIQSSNLFMYFVRTSQQISSFNLFTNSFVELLKPQNLSDLPFTKIQEISDLDSIICWNQNQILLSVYGEINQKYYYKNMRQINGWVFDNTRNVLYIYGSAFVILDSTLKLLQTIISQTSNLNFIQCENSQNFLVCSNSISSFSLFDKNTNKIIQQIQVNGFQNQFQIGIDDQNQSLYIFDSQIQIFSIQGIYNQMIQIDSNSFQKFEVHQSFVVLFSSSNLIVLDRVKKNILSQIQGPSGLNIVNYLFLDSLSQVALYCDNSLFAQIYIFNIPQATSAGRIQGAFSWNQFGIVLGLDYDTSSIDILYLDDTGNFYIYELFNEYDILNNCKITEVFDRNEKLLGFTYNQQYNNVFVYSKTSIYQINYSKFGVKYQYGLNEPFKLFTQVPITQLESQFLLLNTDNNIFRYQNQSIIYESTLNQTPIDLMYAQTEDVLIIGFSDRIVFQFQYQNFTNSNQQKKQINLNNIRFFKFLQNNIYLTYDKKIIHCNITNGSIINSVQLDPQLFVTKFLSNFNNEIILIGLSNGSLLQYNLQDQSQTYYTISKNQDIRTSVISICIDNNSQQAAIFATNGGMAQQINIIQKQLISEINLITSVNEELNINLIDLKFDITYNRYIFFFSGQKKVYVWNYLTKDIEGFLMLSNNQGNKITQFLKIYGLHQLGVFENNLSLNIYDQTDITQCASLISSENLMYVEQLLKSVVPKQAEAFSFYGTTLNNYQNWNNIIYLYINGEQFYGVNQYITQSQLQNTQIFINPISQASNNLTLTENTFQMTSQQNFYLRDYNFVFQNNSLNNQIQLNQNIKNIVWQNISIINQQIKDQGILLNNIEQVVLNQITIQQMQSLKNTSLIQFYNINSIYIQQLVIQDCQLTSDSDGIYFEFFNVNKVIIENLQVSQNYDISQIFKFSLIQNLKINKTSIIQNQMSSQQSRLLEQKTLSQNSFSLFQLFGCQNTIFDNFFIQNNTQISILQALSQFIDHLSSFQATTQNTPILSTKNNMAKKSQRFRLRTISQSIQESKKFIDQDFVEQTQTYQESLETDHNKVEYLINCQNKNQCGAGCKSCAIDQKNNGQYLCSLCNQGYTLDGNSFKCVYSNCLDNLYFQIDESQEDDSKGSCVSICNPLYIGDPIQKICVLLSQCSSEFQTEQNFLSSSLPQEIFIYQEIYYVVIQNGYLSLFDRNQVQLIRHLNFESNDLKVQNINGLVMVLTNKNQVAKWDIISGERQIIYNSTDQQITQQTLLTNLNGQYMILQFISENSLQLKVIYDFSKNNSLVSNLISFDSSNNQIQLSSNLVVQQFEKQMTVEQVILQNSNNLELSLSNKITCDTSLVGTVIQIINTQSLDEYFSIHENGIFHITISQNSCLIKLSQQEIIKGKLINFGVTTTNLHLIILTQKFLFDFNLNTTSIQNITQNNNSILDFEVGNYLNVNNSIIIMNSQNGLLIYNYLELNQSFNLEYSTNFTLINSQKLYKIEKQYYNQNFQIQEGQLEYEIALMNSQIQIIRKSFIHNQQLETEIIDNFQMPYPTPSSQVNSLVLIYQPSLLLSCHQNGDILFYDTSSGLDFKLINKIQNQPAICLQIGRFNNNYVFAQMNNSILLINPYIQQVVNTNNNLNNINSLSVNFDKLIISYNYCIAILSPDFSLLFNQCDEMQFLNVKNVFLNVDLNFYIQTPQAISIYQININQSQQQQQSISLHLQNQITFINNITYFNCIIIFNTESDLINNNYAVDEIVIFDSQFNFKIFDTSLNLIHTVSDIALSSVNQAKRVVNDNRVYFLVGYSNSANPVVRIHGITKTSNVSFANDYTFQYSPFIDDPVKNINQAGKVYYHVKHIMQLNFFSLHEEYQMDFDRNITYTCGHDYIFGATQTTQIKQQIGSINNYLDYAGTQQGLLGALKYQLKRYDVLSTKNILSAQYSNDQIQQVLQSTTLYMYFVMTSYQISSFNLFNNQFIELLSPQLPSDSPFSQISEIPQLKGVICWNSNQILLSTYGDSFKKYYFKGISQINGWIFDNVNNYFYIYGSSLVVLDTNFKQLLNISNQSQSLSFIVCQNTQLKIICSNSPSQYSIIDKIKNTIQTVQVKGFSSQFKIGIDEDLKNIYLYDTSVYVYNLEGIFNQAIPLNANTLNTFEVQTTYIIFSSYQYMVFIDRKSFQLQSQIQAPSGLSILKYIYMINLSQIILYCNNSLFAQVYIYSIPAGTLVGKITGAFTWNNVGVVKGMDYDSDQSLVLYIDDTGNFYIYQLYNEYTLLNNYKLTEVYDRNESLLGFTFNRDYNNIFIYSKTSIYQINYSKTGVKYQFGLKEPSNLFTPIPISQYEIQFIVVNNDKNVFKYKNLTLQYENTFNEQPIDVFYDSNLDVLVYAFTNHLYFTQQYQYSLNNGLIPQTQILENVQFYLFLMSNMYLTYDKKIIHCNLQTAKVINIIQLNTQAFVTSFQNNYYGDILLIGFSNGQLLQYNLTDQTTINYTISNSQTINISIIKIIIDDNNQAQQQAIIATNGGQVAQLDIIQHLQIKQINLVSLVNEDNQINLQDFIYDKTYSRYIFFFSGEKKVYIWNFISNKQENFLMLPNDQGNYIKQTDLWILTSCFYQINVYQRSKNIQLFTIIKKNNFYDTIIDYYVINNNQIIILFQNRFELFLLQNQNNILISQQQSTYPRFLGYIYNQVINFLKIYILDQTKLFETNISLQIYQDNAVTECASIVNSQNFLIAVQQMQSIIPKQSEAFSFTGTVLTNQPNWINLIFLQISGNQYDIINTFMQQQSLQNTQIITSPQNQTANNLTLSQNTFQNIQQQTLYLSNYSLIFQSSNQTQLINVNQNIQKMIWQNITIEGQQINSTEIVIQNVQQVIINEISLLALQSNNFNYLNNSLIKFINIESVLINQLVIQDSIYQQQSQQQLLEFYNIKNVTINQVQILSNQNVNQIFSFSLIANLTLTNFQILENKILSQNRLLQTSVQNTQNSALFQLYGCFSSIFYNFLIENNNQVLIVQTYSNYTQNNQLITLMDDVLQLQFITSKNNVINNQPIYEIRSSLVEINQLIYSQNQGSFMISLSKQVKISNSLFDQNIAQNGGAIYFQMIVQQIQIIKSQFTQNQAKSSGGAIYMEDIGSCLVIFDAKSVIQNNTALIGGGVRIVKKNIDILVIPQNYPFQQNVFNNKAEIYGDDSTTYLQNLIFENYKIPDQQTSYFFDFNNNQTNVPIKYQSKYQKSIQVNDFQSGGYLVLRIYIVDNYNRYLSFSQEKLSAGVYPNEIELELKGIEILIDNSNVYQSQLIGEKILNYNQFNTSSKSYELTGLQIYGTLETQQVFSISSSIFAQSQNQNPILMLIQFRKCLLGEIIQQSTTQISTCKQCETGSYQLIDPQVLYKQSLIKQENMVKNQCNSCPFSANLCQGQTIQLKNGYWRSGNSSDEILKCNTLINSCQAENPQSIEGCIQGYIGPLCEQCDIIGEVWKNQRYTQQVQIGICNQCSETSLQYFFLIGKGVLLIFYFIFTLRVFINQFTYSQICFYLRAMKILPISKNAIKDYSGFFIKIIINYLQLSSLLIQQPQIIPVSFNVLGNFIGQSNKQISIGIDCIISENAIQNLGKVAIYALIQCLIPVIFIVIMSALLFIIQQLRKKLIKKHHYMTLFQIFLIFFQLEQISYFSNSLTCRQIGSQSYNPDDLTQPCGQQDIEMFIIPFSLVILFVWSVLPLAFLYQLYQKRNKLDECKTKYSLGYFYGELKSKYYYWEFVRVFLKIAIVYINILMSSTLKNFSQALIIVIFGAYLKAVFYFQPFLSKQIIKSETIAYTFIILKMLLKILTQDLNSTQFIIELFILIIDYIFFITLVGIILVYKANNQNSIVGKLLKKMFLKILPMNIAQRIINYRKVSFKTYQRWKFIRFNIGDVIKQKAKQNMDIMKDKLIDLNKQSQNHSSVLQNSNNVLTQPSSPNQLLYKEKQKYNFQLYNRNSYPQEKTIFDYVNEDESQEDEQTQQLDPKKVEQYSLNTRPSFQQTLRQNIRLFDMNEQFTNS
ncbi:hypothetical protein ABPG73_000275 [Tetrahymena malaccensis]